MKIFMTVTKKKQLLNFKPSINSKQDKRLMGIDTRDHAEAVKYIRNGVLAKDVLKLQKAFNVPINSFGHTVGISVKTITGKKEAKLKKDQSERVLRFAGLFDHATEVFANIKLIQEWFITPNRCLGGETPLQYADTEPGAQEVDDLLGRLKHGVFS